MTILAPTAPYPPAKLRLHAEQAIDAMSELLDFLHEQETPWHPGEIGFLLMSATHHFIERMGIVSEAAPEVAKPDACNNVRGYSLPPHRGTAYSYPAPKPPKKPKRRKGKKK